VIPRALACAAAALLLAACRGTGERADSSAKAPLPAATPQPAPEVDARFAPGLEALERALAAGEDELARALIMQLDSLGPDERVWQFVRGYERILDGRAGVRSLALTLVCVPEPAGTALPGAQPGAQVWRLVFQARNTGTERIELNPGPATLTATHTDLGSRGTEARALETRSFDKLKRIDLDPGAQSEVELARFFIDPLSGQLAVRLDFTLELRSGVLQRAGRELPAMRIAVAPARATRHSADLPEARLTPEELLAASAPLTQTGELLALAVRTDPGAGGANLADLERALAELSRPRLELWIPALRWLVGPEVPTDVDGLRGWLRARVEAHAAKTPRPTLVLPREPRAPAPERN